MKCITTILILSLLISCEDTSSIEMDLACSKCSITESNKSFYTAYCYEDSVWFSTFDPKGKRTTIEHFQVCSATEELKNVQSGSIVSLASNIYKNCNGDDFIDVLEFESIVNCTPTIDTLNIESNISDKWRLYSINDMIIPCELEPSSIEFIFKEDGTLSVNTLNWWSSGIIKGDSLFLYDHAFLLFLYPSNKGNLFASELSDLVAYDDTTTLVFTIKNNIMEIQNIENNSSILCYAYL